MPVIIILGDLIIIVIIIVTLLNGNVPESNYCIITIFVELYVMHIWTAVDRAFGEGETI